MERREYLVGLTGGLSLFAGCGGQLSEDSQQQESPDDVDWPAVQSHHLSDWERVGKREDTYEESQWGIGVTGHIRTYIYENTAVRAEVKEETLGNFDQTLASFFASRIDLRGLATRLATKEKIAAQARPSFEDEMTDQGIQNVSEVTPHQPQPEIQDASPLIYEYQGEYPTPEITRSVNIEEIGQRELSIESGTLPISGLLAIWKDGSGTAYAAGGAFPAQDYEQTETITITSEEGDGIDIHVSIDLNISPQQLRQQIVDLTESVH